ncbi:MAG: hypothetical protein F4169_15045 [Gammaproteobacteria bacterium]|nr:hypothetical protein [Gammaproteobacteria bacterium]
MARGLRLVDGTRERIGVGPVAMRGGGGGPTGATRRLGTCSRGCDSQRVGVERPGVEPIAGPDAVLLARLSKTHHEGRSRMGAVPTSKSRLTACVRAFDAGAVVAGLKSRPELLYHVDERGRNWLHLCASVDARVGGLDPADAIPLAGALLDLGIDVNAAAFTEGTWRATPLWYAVSRGGNIDLARYLLASGSSPEHCLWAAVYRDDLDMVALLVDAGANLEAVAEAETPLLHAAKYSRFRGAKALLEAGADPDYRDVRGMTALHYMLKKRSDIRHFRTFAAYGARGDIPDRDGRTAAAIMSRKRDPAFHVAAAQLASGSH